MQVDTHQSVISNENIVEHRGDKYLIKELNCRRDQRPKEKVRDN